MFELGRTSQTRGPLILDLNPNAPKTIRIHVLSDTILLKNWLNHKILKQLLIWAMQETEPNMMLHFYWNKMGCVFSMAEFRMEKYRDDHRDKSPHF